MVHRTTDDAAASSGHPGTEIGLQAFCYTRPDRPQLHYPFRNGGFVYATNGHILVRVADDERFSEQPVQAGRVLDAMDRAVFFDAPAVSIPEDANDAEDCPDCEGRGNKHDCPDCQCTCQTCDGLCVIKKRRATMLCGHVYDLHYIRMIYALPELEIAPNVVVSTAVKSTGQLGSPLLFRFKGGVGALMPIRGVCPDTYIEIEQHKD